MVLPDGPLPYSALLDHLKLEQVSPSTVDVHFLSLPRSGPRSDSAANGRVPVRLLQIDEDNCLLNTFPTVNLVRPDKAITSKYANIGRISFSDLSESLPSSANDVIALLEDLPSYCVKNPQFGLGFAQKYRAIAHAIEDLTDAEAILISHTRETGYDANTRTFILSEGDMDDLRLSINRVNNTTRLAANEVNATSTYNTLANVLGIPTRPLKYGRAPLRKVLTALGNDERLLSPAERLELFQTLAQNARSVLEREPATMDTLESEIAAARARDLLGHLQEMMNANQDEPTWQQFLQKNIFVLSLVFGRPFVSISGQASVGGTRIDGSGNTITDFLAKNSLTNNAAIVEIKTPKMKLLNRTEYRNGVYAPSADLVGAMNQALDQKSKFEQGIAPFKHLNPWLRVEAHHVQTYLLAGSMPTEPDRVRSFELFRHNSKDVAVMTFDELLSKVEHLCGFLEGRDEPVKR